MQTGVLLTKGATIQIFGIVIVALTMIEMFTIPKNYFVLASIVSTTSMICVAVLVSKPFWQSQRPKVRNLGVAVVLAFALYGVFSIGNYAIRTLSPFGIQSNNEQTIYGLFQNDPVPLLILVFALDAIGFETYFRGNLQSVFTPRLGIVSVFLVALIDALIHVSTFNPLFPATVLVSDSVWGLNYYFTKDIYSNIATHFLWDLLIFVLFPIH